MGKLYVGTFDIIKYFSYHLIKSSLFLHITVKKRLIPAKLSYSLQILFNTESHLLFY